MIDGLEADVVTLALAADIDAIAKTRQDRRPTGRSACRNNSAPYTSTIVFLVRKGNPKASGTGTTCQARRRGHHPEPEDLGRRALELPRRLGLRATAAGRQRRQGAAIRRRALQATCRCSTPARAARPTTFAQRGIGDVLIAWENEAYLALDELGAGQVRDRRAVGLASWPSRRSPWSTATSTRKGTRKVAEAYLEFLYSPPAQEIIAQELLPPARRRGRRPKYADAVPEDQARHDRRPIFGGWTKAQPHALRRRRHVRPDLQGVQVTRRPRSASARDHARRLRLRLSAGRHHLPWPSRPVRRTSRPAHEDDPIAETAARTRKMVELAASKYEIVKWNKRQEIVSEGLKGAPNLSFAEKSAYYTFLREATRAYDNFAEELFWCWKSQQCDVAPLKKQCQLFSSILPHRGY